MKIQSVECSAQAFTPAQLPRPNLPEVAVFGRSNVGKSALLGALMGRKRLARVSSTPGKTRGIFLYRVNERVVLADLPGYGYSKAPRAFTSLWRPLLEAYLDRPGVPALALRLLDIRHPPTEDDLAVGRILADRDIPVFIIATKSDKLTRGAVPRALAALGEAVGAPPEAVIPFSVKQGSAPAEDLWGRIERNLARRPHGQR